MKEKMPDMNEKSALVARHLSFTLPTGETLFDNVDLAVNKGDRIALMGRNGVGKSTLLKVLAGAIRPTSGSIDLSTTSYVDQLDEGIDDRGDQTLMDYMNVANEEWWRIQIYYEKMFGQELPDVSMKLKQLSGGEYMRLKLAIATFKEPKILLLDEPTNHLDISSKEVLRKFIEKFAGGVVIVSHDTYFVDQVAKEVWELSEQKLKKYGGNYQKVTQIKEQDDEARQRRLMDAEKEITRAKETLVREQKRASRSVGTGKRMAGDRSMSAMERGYFKNRATASAGKKSEKIKSNINEARERTVINRKVKNKMAKLDISETEGFKGKMLLGIKDCSLIVGGRELIGDINFSVGYGERIVLSGKNGSGKTSFIKMLLGSPASDIELRGQEVKRAPNLPSMYVSQRYDQIDRKKSLIDNIFLANPRISLQEARTILGNLLFKKQHEVDKLAKSLSGGETARLAFAIVSASPVSLLVLDEPTNNLDVETVDIIAETLKQFEGAILVVSHDIDFLKKINIDKAYMITKNKIKEMANLPIEEGFYQELLAEQPL